MATYRVYLKRVNKSGVAPVYVGFYLNGDKVEVPVKISVQPDSFDSEKGIIKKIHPFASDYNMLITKVKSEINDVFMMFRLKNEDLTTTMFWLNYQSEKKSKDFFAFCEEYQKLRFQEVALGTKKKHITILKTFREFKHEIYFSDITVDFLRKWVLWLKNKKKHCDTTIKKDIKVLSIYLNDAVKKNIIKENPVKQLKLNCPNEETAEALTKEELSRLCALYESHTLSGTIQDVLEFFLFMCLSSLHVTDAKRLTIEQIGDNEFWYVRIKMMHVRPKIVRVPICPSLRKIIDKNMKGRKEGLLWNEIISDQRINKSLKDIAKMEGITINLSCKVGRHTFATIFLRETHDYNTLKDIMGHSNISQTLMYSHVMDCDRATGIKVFDSFII